MTALDGKMRLTDVLDASGIVELEKSMLSNKADNWDTKRFLGMF